MSVIEADPLFTQDIVRSFILEQGGKVSNKVLVKHFRSFLNDPVKNVANREKFKSYVNVLSSCKLDKNGDKVLVLKAKYKDDYVPPSNTTAASVSICNPPINYAAERPKKKKTRDPSFLNHSDASPGQNTTTAGHSQNSQTQMSDSYSKLLEASSSPQPSFAEDMTSANISAGSLEVQMSNDYSKLLASAGLTPEKSPPPPAQQAESTIDNVTMVTPESSPRYDDKSQISEDSESFHSVSSNARSPETTPEPSYCSAVGDTSVTVTQPGANDVSVTRVNRITINTLPRSMAQVTKSINNSGDDVRQPEAEDISTEDIEGSEDTSFSVKDRAKQLNTIKDEVQSTPSRQSSIAGSDRGNRSSVMSTTMTDAGDPDITSGQGDLRTDTLITVEQKQWTMAATQTDYHLLAKMIQLNPSIVNYKTALHWACKHGNIEILKLLCGTDGINVNCRSGYTPCHIAAQFNHSDHLQMLTQAYGADKNMRDYSGRRFKNYMGSLAPQLCRPGVFKVPPPPAALSVFTAAVMTRSHRHGNQDGVDGGGGGGGGASGGADSLHCTPRGSRSPDFSRKLSLGAITEFLSGSKKKSPRCSDNSNIEMHQGRSQSVTDIANSQGNSVFGSDPTLHKGPSEITL